MWIIIILGSFEFVIAFSNAKSYKIFGICILVRLIHDASIPRTFTHILNYSIHSKWGSYWRTHTHFTSAKNKTKYDEMDVICQMMAFMFFNNFVFLWFLVGCSYHERTSIAINKMWWFLFLSFFPHSICSTAMSIFLFYFWRIHSKWKIIYTNLFLFLAPFPSSSLTISLTFSKRREWG